MEKKYKVFGDIKKLTYLCLNNPWRWERNIENILINSSKEEFFEIYLEICLAYQINSQVTDKDLQWYFEEIFEKRVIDPEIEIKKYGPRGEGLADLFFDERQKIHNQYLEDIKNIYILWKEVGIMRDFNVSLYPDELDEHFD